MRLLVSLLSLTMGCEAYLAFPPSVYVCRTFPFCKMDLKTRAWSSSLTDGQGETTGMFEALEMPDSIRKIASQQGNFSREGKADDSACWINSAYCAPDYSVPPLTGIDVDSAAKCRAACKKDEDCNYFTFHNYHGQAKCYKLSACSLTVAKHCPSSGKCASGSAECGCPSLEANPTDSSSTTAYATWSCDSGVDPYSQTIPAGTNCKTDCKGWTGQVSVSLASTCQPMGDWSDTQTGYGKRSARNGRSFNLNKPDSGPIKCACRDLGPYTYNPNTRSGETGITRFQCDGWSPEKYTAPFNINANDRCNLFCDKALVKTILCEANTWSGEPEKGFWCMSPPEQVQQLELPVGEVTGQGIKEDQDGVPWTKVFAHDTSGGLFKSNAEALSKNPEDPGAKLFSVLDKLDTLRLEDGTFHLKLCYPDLGKCNEWTQTSNPATSSKIEDFKAIDLAFQKASYGAAFVGIGVSISPSTFIDDSPSRSNWWNAIGAQKTHGGVDTIPGPYNVKVKRVELFAEKPSTLSQERPAKLGEDQKGKEGRSIKLHSDSTFDYYKVEVEAGVTMVEGATSIACEKLAMRAVCQGPSGCYRNDESKCQVTPLETNCGGPMVGISQAICDGETNASKCAKLEGVFQYRKGWSGGEQGVVGGKWVVGRDHTSGDGDKTFAFCTKAKST